MDNIEKTNVFHNFYLELTDEEIINIASNTNLPDFITQLPYLTEQLQKINKFQTCFSNHKIKK